MGGTRRSGTRTLVTACGNTEFVPVVWRAVNQELDERVARQTVPHVERSLHILGRQESATRLRGASMMNDGRANVVETPKLVGYLLYAFPSVAEKPGSPSAKLLGDLAGIDFIHAFKRDGYVEYLVVQTELAVSEKRLCQPGNDRLVLIEVRIVSMPKSRDCGGERVRTDQWRPVESQVRES